MINTPLLSILIATRNRIEYCKSAILSILENKEFNFELVIQDNSDTYELQIFCQNIADSRLVYNYTPPPFSSIDNFNAVIEKASGKYLCLIGDDDSVNPDILKVVRFANANNIESIVPVIKSVYLWPDTCQTLSEHKNKNGVLNISKITGEVNIYNPIRQVKLLMKNGAQNYLSFKLPKLYHGIIRKDKMDQIKYLNGFYIGGLSPDIYAAISLSFIVDKVYYIDFPLTIPGICTQSTSGEAAVKKTIEKLEDAIHFRDRGEYTWSELVPRFYSDENIWADTAIAALKDSRNYKMLDNFNLKRLTSILLKKYPLRVDIITTNYFNHLEVNNFFAKKILLILIASDTYIARINNAVYRIKNKIKSKNLKSKLKSNNIEETEFINLINIFQATSALKAYLSNQSLSVKNINNRLKEILK
jgi:glycosyltransferase involved in cell wall biosynthesis